MARCNSESETFGKARHTLLLPGEYKNSFDFIVVLSPFSQACRWVK